MLKWQIQLFNYHQPMSYMHNFRRLNSLTPLYQNKWWSIRRKTSSCHLFMTGFLHNSKPKLSEIHHIKLKPIHRLLLQFNRLSLIRGVLHCRTFKDDDEIQQLILPQQLCKPILKSLHDDNGHQGSTVCTEFIM